MGPFSSIGSPTTFMILPKHSGPTGIVIGDPVSITSVPLTNPSVLFYFFLIKKNKCNF